MNTVAPGLFDTPIYGRGPDADNWKAELGKSVVFPSQPGNGEEFAAFVLECIRNCYLNGETIRLDGGIRLPPK